MWSILWKSTRKNREKAEYCVLITLLEKVDHVDGGGTGGWDVGEGEVGTSEKSRTTPDGVLPVGGLTR